MTAVAIGTLRAGSRVRFLKPDGVLIGVLEVHPDHPPRIHYTDGRGIVEYSASEVASWLSGPPSSLVVPSRTYYSSER